MKNLLKSKKPQFGFTLIELLIVVAIIAVLVSLGAVSYTTVQRNARDAQRKSDLKKIALALEKYYTDNGVYPPGGNLDITSSSANPWITGLTSSYLSELPKDPLNTGSNIYRYIAFNTGQNYILLTDLENNSDKDRRNPPTSSPCNETPYYEAHASTYAPSSFDWCVSDPK